MCICVYAYIYIYIYVCMYVCVYVCMYVCMYVCIYIYIYIYIYKPNTDKFYGRCSLADSEEAAPRARCYKCTIQHTACIYIYIYIHTYYTCVYIYIYTHIYTHIYTIIVQCTIIHCYSTIDFFPTLSRSGSGGSVDAHATV